jgi:hypothetical protein
LRRHALHRLHRARALQLRARNHRTLRKYAGMGLRGLHGDLLGERSVQLHGWLHRSQTRRLSRQRMHHGMPRADEIHVSPAVRVRNARVVQQGPRRSGARWLHGLLHPRAGVRVTNDGRVPERSSRRRVRLQHRRHHVPVRHVCVGELHQRCLAVDESALLIRPSGTWRASLGTRSAARSAKCPRGDSRSRAPARRR